MPKEGKVKKPLFKRWWFILIVAIVIISALSSRSGNDESPATETASQNNKKAELEEQLTFKGAIDLKVDNDKVIMTINSNVPDGGIFEVSLMNGKFDVLSEFIPIKDGKIVKEFKIPKDWGIGYVSGMAMFRFNLKDHLQPDHIKEVYGEKGEKMLGDQAAETTDSGYNGTIEPIIIAYPDEATVKSKQKELLLQAFNEMIKSSNGVILKIQPHFEDNDWSSVAVTVSDAWYYSAEHEKERFAEQVGSAIESVIRSAGAVNKDDYVSVYFYDTYQKELATPKILGGYKIKR